MNCFVASAFDHEDVDAIYDLAIRPVLAEFKLRPSRVDRVEHNDDIDDEIFRLIDESSLCIADLTYARPSVYYEAGYAFGKGMPVIYLARSDHFRAQQNDPAGNLRVHFDLQMKNIIPWTEPNEAFRTRLRKRLRHVLRPMLREQQLSQSKRDDEKRFGATSQNEQLVALLNKAKSLLRTRGYSRGRYPEDRPSGRDPHHAHLQKFEGKTYRQVHILARPAVTKKALELLPFLWLPFLTQQEDAQIKKIESVCLVIALRAVTPTALRALFPSWTPISDRLLRRTAGASMRDEVPHSTTIAVIDGLKSLPAFAQRCRQIVGELEKGQQGGGEVRPARGGPHAPHR
jgi:nucleoside 2-deoxyribosyltransferase